MLCALYDREVGVKILIDAGADVNARDQEGYTPLMYAVMKHNVYLETVTVLIDAGADVNASAGNGETVLEIMLSGDHDSSGASDNITDVFNFLMNSGARVTPGTNEETDESDTTDWDSADILKTLAEFGLKPRDNFKDLFECNDVPALVRAVENGLDPGMEDSSHDNFFRSAVKYGTYDVVKACVDAGVYVNAEHWSGYPNYVWPVFLAIKEYNPSTLRALIDAGAKLEDVSLMEWSMRDNVFPEGGEADDYAKKFRARLDAGAEVLRILAEAGASIAGYASDGAVLTYVGVGLSYGKDRYSPEDSDEPEPDITLREKNDARGRGDPRAVSKPRRAVSRRALTLLTEAGADIRARGYHGETILHHIACDYEDGYFQPDAMIEFLIGAGADIDASDDRGATPLMLAVRNIALNIRALSAVMIFASHGANFGAIDKEGRSVADWAGESVDDDDECRGKLLLRDLIEEIGNSGARVNAANAALMAISCYGGVDDIKAALSSGANVNSAGKTGFTPLMFAAVFNENAEAVKTLLSAGADIEAEDNSGNTALKLSMNNARFKTAKTLLTAGANPGSVITGKTPSNDKARDFPRCDCGKPDTADVLRGFGLIVR
jgi:ankyrin repeat protein